MAQIVAWGDRDLERLYQYGRILLIRLPGRPQVSVDIGDTDLSHYRQAWSRPGVQADRLGFSGRFAELVTAGFPGAGSYVGPKSAIGL
jgi:hypothetical protein